MFVRWLKFNFVGAAGIGVQLLTLAILTKVFRVEYMIATAIAVEATVLHNYLWHERYTWIDRRHQSHFWRGLLQFNLSNGLISILGNVALMRLLVGTFHLPILIANGIAIVACGLVNFLVSDRVVFRHRPAKARASTVTGGEERIQQAAETVGAANESNDHQHAHWGLQSGPNTHNGIAAAEPVRAQHRVGEQHSSEKQEERKRG